MLSTLNVRGGRGLGIEWAGTAVGPALGLFVLVRRLVLLGEVEIGVEPRAGQVTAQLGKDRPEGLPPGIGGREELDAHAVDADMGPHRHRPEVVRCHVDGQHMFARLHTGEREQGGRDLGGERRLRHG